MGQVWSTERGSRAGLGQGSPGHSGSCVWTLNVSGVAITPTAPPQPLIAGRKSRVICGLRCLLSQTGIIQKDQC